MANEKMDFENFKEINTLSEAEAVFNRLRVAAAQRPNNAKLQSAVNGMDKLVRQVCSSATLAQLAVILIDRGALDKEPGEDRPAAKVGAGMDFSDAGPARPVRFPPAKEDMNSN